MRLIYSLNYIPDLTLIKYQALADSGIDGVLKRNNSFLRQWQKISSTYDIEINYVVRYHPNSNNGEKLHFYLVFQFQNTEIKQYISSLMKASSIAEIYNMQLIEEDSLDSLQYTSKTILKKSERMRECSKEDKEKIPLYYVDTWEVNEEARLYEMFHAMESLDTDIVYRVLLKGKDAYDRIYTSLEKPIQFLRSKTLNRNQQMIKLQENSNRFSRDIVAEEILKLYEEFLKDISSSPCYKVNVEVYSNDSVASHLLLNTVCGESIEKGNWEMKIYSEDEYKVLDSFQEYNEMMPATLSYWPTYFTLEEITPFFRFPILYEGENIQIKKETEPKDSVGELHIGENLHKKNVNLPVGLLKKHAFICGVPGAGKTNTMLHLCYTLWKKCQVPFLVLEPAKKEYRALAQTDMEELIVFSPGAGSRFPMAINPFEFAIGLSLSEHIQNMMDVFEGAFPLTPPLPALIDRAIEGVYKNHGWDTDDVNDGKKEYPTMSELYERLEFELDHTDYDGEVRGNMKSALEMRIGSLLRRDLGNVFDVPISTIRPERIIESPIIIEMESMGTGPSNFMTLMLCTLIREVLKVNPIFDGKSDLRHVLFIEEAHNLIAEETRDLGADEANPKVAATNYIVKMLAEVRALKEGIIIADQLPTAMASEVIKNTSLKIVHRLTSEDDRMLVGSTMSASGMQMEELATYTPGNALISYEGLLKPFRMQISSFEWKDAPSTDELFDFMKEKVVQNRISEITFSIRLSKYKEKWIHEWNLAMAVYDQLKTDCQKLKTVKFEENLEDIMSQIVKDQLGLEKCLDKLREIVKKYQYTMQLAMKVSDSDNEFYKKMEKGIENMIYNTKILLTK